MKATWQRFLLSRVGDYEALARFLTELGKDRLIGLVSGAEETVSVWYWEEES